MKDLATGEIRFLFDTVPPPRLRDDEIDATESARLESNWRPGILRAIYEELQDVWSGICKIDIANSACEVTATRVFRTISKTLLYPRFLVFALLTLNESPTFPILLTVAVDHRHLRRNGSGYKFLTMVAQEKNIDCGEIGNYHVQN